MSKRISILGGGPAGLSLAYFLNQEGLEFTLFEKQSNLGGNAQTYSLGDFKFDSGAHRLHNKIPWVTQTFKQILGDDLKEIEVPSYIHVNGKFLDFPLSPGDLLKKMPLVEVAQAFSSFVYRKINPAKGEHFSAKAINTYGKIIAEKLLLNYSEKLWGLPCDQLDPVVAGGRLKGLDFTSLALDVLGMQKSRTRHLDGSFYYPTHGIGMLTQGLVKDVNPEFIHKESSVSKIITDGNRIKEIEVEGESKPVDELLCTLAPTLLLRMMQPAPPNSILELLQDIQFRNLGLLVITLNKPSVTDAASLYFPDPKLPFTRVVEPRNRSAVLSPKGKTSLVVEIPHFGESQINPEKIIGQLVEVGLFTREEVLETDFKVLKQAYPVLAMGTAQKVEKILAYLETFENLHICGRNATFTYGHLHNMMEEARSLVTKLC